MRVALIVIAFFITSSLSAQKQYKQVELNDNLKNVVAYLAKQYHFKFSYNPKLLEQYEIKKVVNARNDAELISQVFQNLPFKLQLVNGIYLIIPDKNFKLVALSGKVLDKATGRPLAYAHIKTTVDGAVSNQDGRFNLPPRKDTLMMKVSYIGYKDITLKIPPYIDQLDFELEQDPVQLPEVILTTDSIIDGLKPSFFSLAPDHFDALPVLGGIDVFKTLQLLPGISGTDESSSGLFIRGGAPSQNLVLMDGFTLYNLDHFFGIYSTLNPSVINNVDVYKGGFGAQYGGRTNSVIDVSGKSGSSESFTAGLELNALSINMNIEAPLGSRTSFLLGGRWSLNSFIDSDFYDDFLETNRQSFLQSFSDDLVTLKVTPSVTFFDLNGKLKHQFSNRSTADINMFLSSDEYTGDFFEDGFGIEDQASWKNSGLSIRWNYQVKPNWYTHNSISLSEFVDNDAINISQEFFDEPSDSLFIFNFIDYTVSNRVGDLTIKSDHELLLARGNTLFAGIELNNLVTDYYSTQSSFFSGEEFFELYNDSLSQEANITSLYGSYQYKNEDLVTNLGIRGSYFDVTDKWYFEPRVDLSLQIVDHLRLKAAASYHHQFTNETSQGFIENNDQFYWVLANDGTVPIQKSFHLIFGANYTLNRWSFDLEYYRKNTDGIFENQFFINLPPSFLDEVDIQDLDLGGENVSEGVDAHIKYRKDNYTSWLSYSLGYSNDAFWFRNENRFSPSRNDQRHEINFVNMLKLGNWDISSTVLYGSGKPYTPSNPVTAIDEEGLYNQNLINQERLPYYFRIDIGAKYNFKIGRLSGSSGVTLFNITDRVNIRNRRFVQAFDEVIIVDNEPQQFVSEIIQLDTNLLGFTPNFFLKIQF